MNDLLGVCGHALVIEGAAVQAPRQQGIVNHRDAGGSDDLALPILEQGHALLCRLGGEYTGKTAQQISHDIVAKHGGHLTAGNGCRIEHTNGIVYGFVQLGIQVGGGLPAHV